MFFGGTLNLDAEAEYELRREDFVLEMPQSGERIRGRQAMREMQEAFPKPPEGTLRRIVGSGDVWVIEGVNDYGGDVWRFVDIIEFEAGSIARETRYYTQPFEAPEWRSKWAERM
jgi:hypothetical protein